MLALGIDPGIAICGYGIVELRGSCLRTLGYGAIETSSLEYTAQRLQIIYQELDLIIKKFKPDIVGIEQLFFNKNVRTAMTVGQARGVILLAAAQNGYNVAEYTPLQVKQAVVGFGTAKKEQVIYMTQKLLNLQAKPKPDDVADALAIAICSVHTGSVSKIWESRR